MSLKTNDFSPLCLAQTPTYAKLLAIQPITLTRLIDRLCASGLVERRADANDRRANRLYLTSAARPLMTKLRALREEINQTALAHLKPDEADQFLASNADSSGN